MPPCAWRGGHLGDILGKDVIWTLLTECRVTAAISEKGVSKVRRKFTGKSWILSERLREEKMRQKLGKTASFHLRTAPKLLLALTLDDRFNPEKRVCSQLSLPGRAREFFLGLALSYCLLQTDKHQPRLVIAFKLQPAAMGKRLEDHKYWLTKPWNGSKLLRKGTCWVRAPCDLVLTRNEFYPGFSSSSRPWVLEKIE